MLKNYFLTKKKKKKMHGEINLSYSILNLIKKHYLAGSKGYLISHAYSYVWFYFYIANVGWLIASS